MSSGPMNPVNPTAIPAIANCAELQAKYRTEAAKTQETRDRFTASDDRYRAAKKQWEDCKDELTKNNQILQGLAGQIGAIPGCAIPN